MNLLGGFYVSKALPWSAQDACNWLPTVPVVDGVRSPLRLRAAPGLRDIAFEEGDGFGGATVFTTPPYPQEFIEDAAVSASIIELTLRPIRRDLFADEEVAVSASVSGITLRPVRRDLLSEIEHVLPAASMVGITLRQALRQAEAPTEHTGTSASIVGITLRRARIDADPGIEHTGVAASIVGVTLRVP